MLILSIYQGKSLTDLESFHFKGVYKGEKIKEIKLCTNQLTEFPFIEGETYLCRVSNIFVNHNILYADLVEVYCGDELLIGDDNASR